MKTLLAVFSCGVCSGALMRHWPYFLRQKADKNIVIGTVDKHCDVPDATEMIRIGIDSYIQGNHLPRRMLDTINTLTGEEWDALILAEYDSLFINPIQIPEHFGITSWGVAAHHAGAFSPDYGFYHNPWVFNRESALMFCSEGEKVIQEGICQDGSLEASPDVFFGRVCHRMKIPVQVGLWKEFSRNSLDCDGDLDRAREAYRSGIDIIHGVKTEQELNYITT